MEAMPWYLWVGQKTISELCKIVEENFGAIEESVTCHLTIQSKRHEVLPLISM